MKAKVLQIATPCPQNFEEILESLGGFGKFQIFVSFLILFFEIPTAFVIFIQIFTGHAPYEWDCDGEIMSAVSACACNGTLSAPPTSFVAEWQLICDSAWVSDSITSVQMAGMVVGVLLASQLSDWYGRRWTTVVNLLVLLLGQAVSAVAPNLYVYTVARFICGAGFASFLNLSNIYTMEFMPARWRGIGGCMTPYGEAIMALALLAHFVSDWRTLTWITATPFAFILIFFPFLPESPRWLLQHGKTEELAKVLKVISKMNSRPPIPMEVLEKIVARECPPPKLAPDGTPQKDIRPNYLVFFKSNPKGLRRKAICIMAILFSWSALYFGISFNIKNMDGNLYWNVVFLGATDSIGFPTALIILNRFGRRASVILSMFVGAFFLVVLAILQLTVDVSSCPTLILILLLCGKFGISVNRSASRALAGESFPTSIRSMAGGICGVSCSIGGIISAQLAYLGSTNPAYPFLTFAIIGVAGSLFALLMPETTGQPLQETLHRKRSKAFSIISAITAGNIILKTELDGPEDPNKF